LSLIKLRDPLELVLALVMEVEKRQRELQAVATRGGGRDEESSRRN
jgi:hypothetical protein